MQQFEYKVVAAPQRGEKIRGARTTAERFASALMSVMNELGRDGWEYLRADSLPCEERVGLTGKSTSVQHMLVFRRALPVQQPGLTVDRTEVVTPPRAQTPKLRGRLFSITPEGAAPPSSQEGPRLGRW